MDPADSLRCGEIICILYCFSVAQINRRVRAALIIRCTIYLNSLTIELCYIEIVLFRFPWTKRQFSSILRFRCVNNFRKSFSVRRIKNLKHYSQVHFLPKSEMSVQSKTILILSWIHDHSHVQRIRSEMRSNFLGIDRPPSACSMLINWPYHIRMRYHTAVCDIGPLQMEFDTSVVNKDTHTQTHSLKEQ